MEKGLVTRKVADLLNQSPSSVSYIWRKYQDTGSVENLPGSNGRPRNSSLEEDLLILKEVEKNPNITTAELSQKAGIFLAEKTLRRRLDEAKRKFAETKKSQDESGGKSAEKTTANKK